MRQEHSPFLRRPVQDGRVFRAARPNFLHTNKFEIGPAPAQAAHDVIVEVLIGDEA